MSTAVQVSAVATHASSAAHVSSSAAHVSSAVAHSSSAAAHASSAVPVSTAVSITSQASTRPQTTTTTTSILSTPTPFNANAEHRADTQRTNKILIGIFSGVGVVVLGLVALQLLRCYRRRQRANSVPLPPPRRLSMSQVGYRNSRPFSMYAQFPTPDFSPPPSAILHQGNSLGSASGIISKTASVEVLGTDDTGPKGAEGLKQPGHAARESTSDKSITGNALATNNDEEFGRRLSPLGSRSQSPSGLTAPRPASQAQSFRRPESRIIHPRPNSIASTSRQSYLNSSWQPGQRNSMYGAPNRSSYYGSGNHGAPHSPHARERVGLMMPQPLAPELFNYALSGRHDMGLDFMQGWGGQGNPARGGAGQPLAGPDLRRARTDSWVAPDHAPSVNESRPSISEVPPPPTNDDSLPRGRSTQPDIPRP